MSFWETATSTERLRQIDAGIELGMTAKQVAMNFGLHEGTDRHGSKKVLYFALNHGRHFKRAQASVSSKQSISMKHYWDRRIQDHSGTLPADAFDIFGDIA